MVALARAVSARAISSNVVAFGIRRVLTDADPGNDTGWPLQIRCRPRNDRSPKPG